MRAGEALFEAVAGQLDEAGFVLRQGTLIDATLVRSAVAAPPRARRLRDRRAARPTTRMPTGPAPARAGGCSSATRCIRGVDQGSGPIRSRIVTPAKVAESRVAESRVADRLVMGDERAVYALDVDLVAIAFNPRRAADSRP